MNKRLRHEGWSGLVRAVESRQIESFRTRREAEDYGRRLHWHDILLFIRRFEETWICAKYVTHHTYANDTMYDAVVVLNPVLGGEKKNEIQHWVFLKRTENPHIRMPLSHDGKRLDNAPVCCENCKYRMQFTGYDRQRNALRMETASMVSEWRCGARPTPTFLDANARGSHVSTPLDFEPCVTEPGFFFGMDKERVEK